MVKIVIVLLSCFLLIGSSSAGGYVQHVSSGIYSKKTASNGLSLPATSTFKPITTLTNFIHIDKPYSVFVHYQVTLYTGGRDFYSKLIINQANVGSLVHSGVQTFKTAIGYYMTKLNPGYYTFEVHYKSPVAIYMGADWDWQAAVLQVMWFEDANVISTGIKCYPTPPVTNTYNNWGPLNNLKVELSLPNNRPILSAYQISAEMTGASSTLVTALNVDGFYQLPTSTLKGDVNFVDVSSLSARNYYRGIHYFSVLYRSLTQFSFTDCSKDYKNNQNLYAMMLPPTCNAITVTPTTSFTTSSSNTWAQTDVTYYLTLSKLSHVIIMYNYAGLGGNTHIVTRLSINAVAQKHTVSITGDTAYVGNSGVWQGPLSAGTHKIALEYRTPGRVTHTVEWRTTFYNIMWQSRSMTIIHC